MDSQHSPVVHPLLLRVRPPRCELPALPTEASHVVVNEANRCGGLWLQQSKLQRTGPGRFSIGNEPRCRDARGLVPTLGIPL